MAKIPNHIVTDILSDQGYYEDSWWEYENDIEHMINDVDSEYSWQWRMEVSIRKNEGWLLYTAPSFANTLDIFTWLEDNGVKFKSEDDQFLVQDPQWFTALSMLWG